MTKKKNPFNKNKIIQMDDYIFRIYQLSKYVKDHKYDILTLDNKDFEKIFNKLNDAVKLLTSFSAILKERDELVQKSGK